MLTALYQSRRVRIVGEGNRGVVNSTGVLTLLDNSKTILIREMDSTRFHDYEVDESELSDYQEE